MEWSLQDSVEVGVGSRGFYALRYRHHARRYVVWFYGPGRTGVPIGEHADIGGAQQIATQYDAPRKRGRKAKAAEVAGERSYKQWKRVE